MAIYKVQANQNIWDIAIHLYGSIEGIFDLLISNPQLHMGANLTNGMELEYHDYFILNKDIVSKLKSENLTPNNGERHVYYKQTEEPLVVIGKIPAEEKSSDFSVSGEGVMIIDWGDNTDLEYINLTHQKSRILHYFDSIVDERKIKIYGQFTILSLNLTSFVGQWLPVRPLVVDEFTSCANANLLKGLFLFEGTVQVDLREMFISDLSPIYNMSLQELDMRGVSFTSVDVLDDYLVHIAENYGNRRNCTVYLDTEPSEKGMTAIQTIINEPEWNEAGEWRFVINDIVYTQTE